MTAPKERPSGVLPPTIFAHNRAVVTAQYAVMPPEGILASRLPGFEQTVVRVQTSPAMGARFAQMLLEIAPGGGMVAARQDGVQHLFYVLSGRVQVRVNDATHDLGAEEYVYVPFDHAYQIVGDAAEPSRVIWIKKPYVQIDLAAPGPIVGRRGELERVRTHTDGRYWQYLLPVDDMAFDMNVNILGFEPGNYFPYVETHVMEHGLYMLEGQGLYLLSGDWQETQPDDFIWMGPFCPQHFYCTGWSSAAYLLYKDVNRDVTFD